ncbi:MAG: STAS domain-containing protein [Acidobacteria bacterium]|nr:STAS domain-containing protein [Acidobacteriota bacterium]
MPFELTQIDHESRVSIIALSGKLTMGSQPIDLVWAIDALLKQDKKRIALDFADVAYMDSAALGIIIQARTKVAAAGGE